MSESHDDNELKDVDLSAWEAPEPPDDLADGVIARLGGTEVGAAVPVEEPRPRHRALLIGGVAAAVLALTVGGYALVHSARHVAPTEGSVTAEKAQALSLDGARGDLDPGTDVKWSRQGRTLHVDQRKGTAAWRVDTDERLVIDAGATVASVEASGASLRVEVKMNPTDARILGATALTSAAVAMVTVVVYEGHVKVRDTAQQREYIVEPGTTYTVTVTPAPPEPPLVGVGPVAPSASVADVVIDVGGSVTIHDPAPPTAVQINAAFACTHSATIEIDRDTKSNGVVLLSAGAHAYRVQCDSHEYLGQIVVVRDPLTRTIQKSDTYDQTSPVFDIVAPRTGDAWPDQLSIKGTVILGGRLSIDGFTIPTDPDGRFAINIIPVTNRSVVPVRLDHPNAGAHYAILRAQPTSVTVDNDACDEVSCVLDNYQGACCAKYNKMGKAPTAQPAPPAPATLDRAQISSAVASARPQVEACGTAHPASGVMRVRVTVAGSGKVTSADITKGLAPELDACVQKVLLATPFPKSGQGGTFAYPFVFSAPPAGCDATALRDKGMENVNMGQHAAALAQFEASLRCKDDDRVRQFAFISACNAQNAVKAKLYYKQLTPPLQQKLAVMCVRNKIDLTESPPCDADALEERGLELTQEGQHAAALEKFEAALTCEDNSQRRAEAFTASCNAGSSEKAKLHYKKLSAVQQKKYAAICIRNKTAYDDHTAAAPAAPACDADDLKDRGMEATNMGDHHAALGWYEKSMACKPDPYVTQLAFVASCSSQDAAKARLYFKQLAPIMQNKLKVICTRNNVDLDHDPPPPAADARGYVQLSTQPAAKVLIDGKDTGQTTPVSRLPLTPGKHKVTFVIGDDRFTYPVTVRAGETETLRKDLQ